MKLPNQNRSLLRVELKSPVESSCSSIEIGPRDCERTIRFVDISPSILSAHYILHLFSLHLLALIVSVFNQALVGARAALEAILAVRKFIRRSRARDGQGVATPGAD